MQSAGQGTAIVLLSGGLDSATVLHHARAEGFRLVALAFDYGQRHRIELDHAAWLADQCGAELFAARLDSTLFSGATALVGDLIDVPEDRAIDATIPATYVPARNILFLSHALALAESRGSRDVFLGINALDYSGYPDCRPEFLEAFATMARLGTKMGVEGDPVRFHAPLIELDKAGIIRKGLNLGVDYARTSSCYQPGAEGRPCMRCDSCALRSKGFAEAGLVDPLLQRFGLA